MNQKTALGKIVFKKYFTIFLHQKDEISLLKELGLTAMKDLAQSVGFSSLN